MAKRNKPGEIDEEQVLNMEDLKRHLDMLDRRLDNIDSVVTAVVERVMSQPVTLNIICPNCNKSMEITIMGSGKLKG